MNSNSKSGNSGVVGVGARVSIPSSVRKTIQDIKEITGNHSEDEIYAMLKECSMDPNETAQKLLFQDTFHEVKRKRDRKKELQNSIKESAESKWKAGTQGRGNKGSRGNLTSRHVSHDAGAGKNGKENLTNHFLDKSVGLSSVPNVEAKNISSSSSAATNGPSGLASGSDIIVQNAHASARRGIKQFEAYAGAGSGVQTTPADASKIPKVATGNRDVHGQRRPNSVNSSRTLSSPPPSGAHLSASDPVLLPSQDSRPAGVVGTVRREVGSQHSPVERASSNSNGSKKTTAKSDTGSVDIQVKMPSKFQGPGKNQLQEFSQTASSIHGGSSVSRPSSNYNNRSQTIGTQKAGPCKEWKPKPVNNNLAQGSALAAASSGVSMVSVEVNTLLQPPAAVPETKEDTAELQKKLEESHISDVEHVIIPNHLHVPEVEKLGFCFGSFDTSFSLVTSTNNAPEHDGSPPIPEASECIEEAASEQPPSNQNASTAVEDTDYSYQPPPSHGQESFSAKGDDISSSAPECSESKPETLQSGQQYSVVHTSPNYNFGFVPPMLGNQLAPFDSSESQPRDVSRLPNFLVQQPIDPTNYYAQFYRSSADTDGRISPFHSAGVSTQYNGGVAVVPPQTSQSSQEGGNTLALSTAAPTPLVTQAAGLMQSSLAVPQQPVPVFRQAAGMHLPHYHPNYIPYGHYFSPLYVPPTAIHQLLSNGAFSQQPQAGGVYPPPPSAAARYSLSQYRPGANVGNSAHIGVPGTYAPYGSSPVNYNPSSATTTGNPAPNEDLSASQFQDSNVYVSGQQSESSGVWINAHNRDLSSLQASSFYNHPQGQVALTPNQPGHGNFAGVYHPAQPVTASTVHPLMQQSQTMAGPVDMVGPTANVYQRPQHSQINWPSSY
ncbi:GBF-interacting protein 1 isoform X4 [Nicotiana tomentosiformis]|uniref:GBF-interacting protein 1 isoform X4 n=1 Tax=Nicotiana tomentosiformis TaxID=4098 RepID=UPI00051BA488|nr:GBF-interacting protein 1-like isoform X4 [Nicotiana tomentosiformis]